MKRAALFLLILAGLAVPNWALAVCTSATVASTTTKVLAANDQGQHGRKWLCVTNNGAQPVWHDVGGGTNGTTATLNQGMMLVTGQTFCWPNGAYSSQTFPMVPNGEVDAITQTGTSNVSACDN